MRHIINILNESQVLDEMPIAHHQTVGNFDKNSSFRHPEDRKIVTSPKAVAKLHKKFANNEFDFGMFFVNSPEANRHTEVGRVDAAWMEQNMPKAWTEIAPNVNPNSINIVFTNNKGSERYPMTPWIIAHRLGHVFYAAGRRSPGAVLWAEAEKTANEYTESLLKLFGVTSPRSRGYGGGYGGYGRDDYKQTQAYDQYKRRLYHGIGTMKSARDNNLRNPHEFLHEMLAQYLTTGSIKFQPINQIIDGYAWGKPQYRGTRDAEEVAHLLQSFENDMNYHIENILHQAVGSLFVM
jgi:hypothetical protein